MRKIIVAGAVVASLVFGVTTGAQADKGGGAPKVTGNALVRAWNLALVRTGESDPWIFDDGCTGGTGEQDPGLFVVPFAEEPVLESHCTVSEDAPLVFGPAGVVCWQATPAEAKAECEDNWSGITSAPLVSATVTIDGRDQKLTLHRTSRSSFTMPPDALLDTPGSTWAMYSIGLAAIRHLDEGSHVVRMRFAYADGFAGDTTFHLDVVGD